MQTLIFPTPYPSLPEQYGARHKAAYQTTNDMIAIKDGEIHGEILFHILC